LIELSESLISAEEAEIQFNNEIQEEQALTEAAEIKV